MVVPGLITLNFSFSFFFGGGPSTAAGGTHLPC